MTDLQVVERGTRLVVWVARLGEQDVGVRLRED
jgi:hypothetical protein